MKFKKPHVSLTRGLCSLNALLEGAEKPPARPVSQSLRAILSQYLVRVLRDNLRDHSANFSLIFFFRSVSKPRP